MRCQTKCFFSHLFADALDEINHRNVDFSIVVAHAGLEGQLPRYPGTLTHSDAALLRLTLADGTEGWGEADPGGINFDGETIDTVMRGLREHTAGLPGRDLGQQLVGVRHQLERVEHVRSDPGRGG